MKISIKKPASWLKICYAFLTCFFASEVYFLSLHSTAFDKAPWFFWAGLGLATFRMAHTISFNGIASWFRDWFTVTVPDSAGGSESIEAKDGWLQPIGELLCCPICSGTWNAVGLCTLYALIPTVGIVAVIVLGAAGLSELFHWWSEKQEWQGRLAREQAGTQWLMKNKGAWIGSFQSDKENQNAEKVLQDV